MAQNLPNFQLLVDALLFFLLPNYLKVNLNFVKHILLSVLKYECLRA